MNVFRSLCHFHEVLFFYSDLVEEQGEVVVKIIIIKKKKRIREQRLGIRRYTCTPVLLYCICATPANVTLYHYYYYYYYVLCYYYYYYNYRHRAVLPIGSALRGRDAAARARHNDITLYSVVRARSTQRTGGSRRTPSLCRLRNGRTSKGKVFLDVALVER